MTNHTELKPCPWIIIPATKTQVLLQRNEVPVSINTTSVLMKKEYAEEIVSMWNSRAIDEQAIRDAALEEAAKLMEELGGYFDKYTTYDTPYGCANGRESLSPEDIGDKIRALKSNLVKE